MIDSRKIEDLHPKVQKLALAFLDECKKQGLEVQVISTYRDFECQDAIYAKGRTVKNPDGASPEKPLGNIVTRAKGGDSIHNYKLALDVLAKRDGKAVWGQKGDGIDNNPGDDKTDDLELWQRVGAAGKKVGLEWAGDWKSFKEYAHFQYTEGLTLSDLKAGKTI